MSIGLWGIYSSTKLTEKVRGAFGKVIEGIKIMSSEELLIATLCGIPIAGLIILMGQALHGGKRLIVFLEFDNASEILKIKTQGITKYRLEETTLDYLKLRIRTKNKVYDGMTMGIYEGIEFSNNGKYIGYVLKDHFTWTKSEIDDISMALTKIGRSPNLL